MLHGGISRETLAKLGVKVKVHEENTSDHIEEKTLASSDSDDSPLASILKKTKPPKPLEKDFFEESRIEISPGLFTKRPSKSLEKIVKANHNTSLDQSPQLPQLKTVNLKDLIGKSQVQENTDHTPELPEFKTTELQLWSTQKKAEKRPTFKSAEIIQHQTSVTPELPALQSQSESKARIEQDKENDEPVNLHAKQTCDTPEMPDLKTINLAKLLQKSKGTFL